MILIIDLNMEREGMGFEEFVRPVIQLVESAGFECRAVHYSELKEVDEFDKIILCGTPLMDNAFRQDIERLGFLRQFGKPVLGVCAGMQLLGELYGSEIVECSEIGMAEIRTVADNKLFADSFEAYELHNYSISQGENFVVLAESDNCVQAVRHKHKPFYGVLFHPEVRNTGIIKNFLELS